MTSPLTDFETVYSILRGDHGNLLSDLELIKIAYQLCDQNILRCKQEKNGIRISMEFEENESKALFPDKEAFGIVGAINKVLSQFGFVFDNIGLDYSIKNEYCRPIKMFGNIFQPYTLFHVKACSALVPKAKRLKTGEGISLAFEDLYCGRISKNTIESKLKLSTDCFLSYKEGSFYLNESFLAQKGSIRYLLLCVLVHHHRTTTIGTIPMLPLTFKSAAETAKRVFHIQLDDPELKFSKALSELRRTVTGLGFPSDLLVETFQEKRTTFFRLMPSLHTQICPKSLEVS